MEKKKERTGGAAQSSVVVLCCVCSSTVLFCAAAVFLLVSFEFFWVSWCCVAVVPRQRGQESSVDSICSPLSGCIWCCSLVDFCHRAMSSRSSVRNVTSLLATRMENSVR